MFELWKKFVNPILEDYKKSTHNVDYATSFNNTDTLYWLKTLKGINIHAIFSNDNKPIISSIFKKYDESITVNFIEIPRNKKDGLSGTIARKYLSKEDYPNFLKLISKFKKPEEYYEALIKGGGKYKKPVKRKTKTLVKRKVKPVKRKNKSLVKRKNKSLVKRKNKSLVKTEEPVKKLVNKGYCEATILDENEPDDPCNIHTTMNECDTETKDTEYWRSYNCKWKN